MFSGENKVNTEEYWKLRGNKAYKEKKFTEALSFYNRALDINPHSVVLLSNRSAVHLFQHNYALAIIDSSKAIQLDSSCIKAYYRKACALKEISNFTEALEVISVAMEIDSENKELKALEEEISTEIHANNILPCDNPERHKFDELIKWLIQGGAIFPKIHMRYYSEDYRGVHSTRPILANECIIFVPKSHIITLEIAKQAPIGSKMMTAQLDLLSPKHSYLSSYILHEQLKPNSFWRPYLNILPEKYANFPIFYTDEEREWLAGSPFLNQINEKIIDIQEDYNEICKAVPEFSQFSLLEFSKIRMAVSSRIFGMEIDGKTTDGFVPLADMLNHSRPRQTSWTYDQKRSGFVVEAMESIPKGVQVMDSYGKKCNSRFLLNYGFIVRNNDADEYPFIVKLNPNDGLFEPKKEALGGSTTSVFRLQACVSDPIFYEFLGAMRLAVIDDHDTLDKVIHEYRENNQFQSRKIKAISLENERNVLKQLKILAEDSLRSYSNTLFQDQALLNTDLTENQRNCVLMTKGEKIILHFFIQMVEDLEPLVVSPVSDFTREDLMNKYQEYLISSLVPLGQIGTNN